MIFRYPGAKTKVAKTLVSFLRNVEADGYVEPFVGGGSVLVEVAKQYPKALLSVNDANPQMAAFWTLIASGSDEKVKELLSLVAKKPTV